MTQLLPRRGDLQGASGMEVGVWALWELDWGRAAHRLCYILLFGSHSWVSP